MRVRDEVRRDRTSAQSPCPAAGRKSALTTAMSPASDDSAVGITSSSRIYRGGLKKCVPNQWPSAGPHPAPTTISVDRQPRRIRRRNRSRLAMLQHLARAAPRLISRFSATTSIIQSHPAISAISSSKLPRVISRADSGEKNAAGFDFFRPVHRSSARTCSRTAGFGASAAVPGGTISSSTTGTPALAMCAGNPRAHRSRAQNRNLRNLTMTLTHTRGATRHVSLHRL